ncbi:hypothetical protein GIB67_008113 [Kingdonia uniflora]|uniref:Uncharacterized protein n=1 Tax=Kingdonia uniflora TaxID=39325 RepID=A0A7J7MT16_9MAGN|nr:hypothetical protein GIB67_008113 [Kingdonia uniflora]
MMVYVTPTDGTLLYSTRGTNDGLGLYKIFAALLEEEKGVLCTTCFVPLLLIDPIATMSMLVVEIFDHHLGDMKFQFGETVIQMKPIHVCLILRLRVSSITNEFLFVDPEHMTIFRLRRCSSIKFVKNYTIISPPEQGEKRLAKRNQIEVPAIGVAPTIEPPTVGGPIVGVPTIVGGYTLPLGDTQLLRQYQFSTPKKTAKHKREGGNGKEDGKRKKAEP